MAESSPTSELSLALVGRAHARADDLVAEGRWDSPRDRDLEVRFEIAVTEALAVRAPAEQSLLIRRLGRLVPRSARPFAKKLLRTLDHGVARVPRRS